MQISKALFTFAVDHAGLSSDQIRHDYPGRGMGGRVCSGITGSISDFAIFVASLAVLTHGTDDEDIAFDLARKVSTDSMGHDTIFYFPGLRIVEED